MKKSHNIPLNLKHCKMSMIYLLSVSSSGNLSVTFMMSTQAKPTVSTGFVIFNVSAAILFSSINL